MRRMEGQKDESEWMVCGFHSDTLTYGSGDLTLVLSFLNDIKQVMTCESSCTDRTSSMSNL